MKSSIGSPCIIPRIRIDATTDEEASALESLIEADGALEILVLSRTEGLVGIRGVTIGKKQRGLGC